MDADRSLPAPGVEGTDVFMIEDRHTTTVFGRQDHPPGREAATDANAAEAVAVLGSPHLLARVEFLSRESVRGLLPTGTGLVGEGADLSHTRPAAVGTKLRVETVLAAVTDGRLRFDGTLRRADTGDDIGSVTVTLRVVDRDRFRAALDG